ncbi:MATH domain and coiled-coil domain-containing protein [Cardamine amara subsp. amara]|uniref:MATH domain and coiled-coil domain-containing protein n=1 Tax=Cardamine amara subsp. amara TaxID=228776 RepID=A0ABD1C8F3_CARAN
MEGSLDGNKFTWLIMDYRHLKSKVISSDPFVIGGYKWHLQAYPKGNNGNKCFCLDLELDDCESLPSGWKRPVEVSFTIVNHINDLFTKEIAVSHWFDHKERIKGVNTVPVRELKDKKSGFMACGILQIIVEVDVYEIVPKSKANQPLKLVNVNGFQVLSSQVDFARRIFEKYPEISLKCCVKNQGLRTSYMNILLSVTKTLFKLPPEQQSTEGLSEVGVALAFLRKEGFKTDWLEKKLDEEKMKCVKVADLVQQINDLMKNHTDLTIQLHKARTDILKTGAPDISFNDVF